MPRAGTMLQQEGQRTNRLYRAWILVSSQRVTRSSDEPGLYVVRGDGRHDYYVDLMGNPPCYCKDMEHRGTSSEEHCKHVIAARILLRDPQIMDELATFLTIPE